MSTDACVHYLDINMYIASLMNHNPNWDHVVVEALRTPKVMTDLPYYAWILFLIGRPDVAIKSIDRCRDNFPDPKLMLTKCLIIYTKEGPTAKSLLPTCIECFVDAAKIIARDPDPNGCCTENANTIMEITAFIFAMAVARTNSETLKKIYTCPPKGLPQYIKSILRSWQDPIAVAMMAIALYGKGPLQQAFISLAESTKKIGTQPLLPYELATWLSFIDSGNTSIHVSARTLVHRNNILAICSNESIIFPTTSLKSPIAAAIRFIETDNELIEPSLIVV